MLFLLSIIVPFSHQTNLTIYRGSYISRKTTNFFISYYFDDSYCQNCSFLFIDFDINNNETSYYIKRTLCGIYMDDLSSFYYIGFSFKNKDAFKCFKLAKNYIDKIVVTDFYEYNPNHFNISNNNVNIFYLKLTNSTQVQTEQTYHGTFSIINITNTTFTAKKIDENKYFKEIQKLVKFCFLFYFSSVFYWSYLFVCMKRKDAFNYISPFSLQMQSSFDYMIFIYYLIEKIEETKPIYDRVNFFIYILYFILHLNFLYSFFFSELVHVINRFNMLTWFSNSAISLLLYNTIVYYLWQYPFICFTMLYSYFIPQILFSYKYKKKTKTTGFYLSLFRLIFIFHITCHNSSILFNNYYSPLLFAFITIYVFIQIYIILLQNKYGGNLIFLRKKGIECPICLDLINDDEDKIITSCNHLFHRECLERWTNTKSICPYCRSPIL